MAITNIDKPTAQNPQTELNVGSGYNLLVGGVYKLVVGALGLGGMTNNSKVSIGETWGTISTTWATETRLWIEASQLFTNVTAGRDLWSSGVLIWTLDTPWQDVDAGMTNESKP